MRKNTDINEELYSKLINQFHKYFETGYAFEEFLKIYLEKLGLDEVVVQAVKMMCKCKCDLA